MAPPPGPRRRLPHQLPAGRHGLSRTFVERNQRERILGAVAETVMDMGYVATAVEDIIATAGVSRRTFYNLYRNKEEAFLAAYDDGVTRLFDAVEIAYGKGETWRERARNGLRAFLESLAMAPELAHLSIVDVLAAGPAALEKRDAAMQRFAEMMEDGRAAAGDDVAVPRMASEIVVGGIHEVIYSRMLRNETASLPALLPELTYSMLLPFVGQPAAFEEYETLRGQTARA
ncbi:MAG TPA: TetR/AcrR family transcriptional regulator [Solirubrobacteraceae bacterium]|nr:TetR/AcrR family transcriptional regulator [Solirubrobacteraceae bacterium]